MKKVRWVVSAVVLLSLFVSVAAFAQYSDPWYTAYQVVNMGSGNANIIVEYYDDAGNLQTGAQKTFNDVPEGGSVLVVQFSDDPNLADGKYSAVVSADQPIAAIVNQQLNPAGSSSWNPKAPFSTYSGQSEGASQITLPAVMYNWYGYYTEISIMNVGSGAATDVDIVYIPGEMDVGSGPETSGASGVTDLNNTIAQYATLTVSQQSESALGAPSGSFAGRFLGSAVITSDQPIIAVVNQHNSGDYKLMTYNGFTSGSQAIYAPSYMRGYFGYYTTLLVANPSDTSTANVEITYTPDTSQTYYNEMASGSTIGPVTVNYAIGPQKALTRYDGPGATDGQSDLDDSPREFVKFFGSVKVTSDIDVMVMVNVEAVSPGDAQAGSYNGIAEGEAGVNLVAPVILADFYGYYTTMIVQNTTGTAGSCDVTYTSDGVYSAVKNASKMYTHALPANGSFTVYEGRKSTAAGDIKDDAFWGAPGANQFIGAASIVCTQPAVAFVNEEFNTDDADSMYTMNTFKK